MNRATSIYLDVVRLGAAVLVVLTHVAYPRFSGQRLAPLRSFGNDAVMVFFVLSGYVIAHTAATRDRNFPTFALNRCARLYSVALPAILATIALDACGRALDPALYQAAWYQADRPWLRIFVSATFTNELWFQSWRLFSNGPYWSLAYEFWYYALFAAAAFATGARRWALLGALALVVGPKILLLAPVWALGVLVQRVNAQPRIGPRAGLALWTGSILLYLAFRAGDGRALLLSWCRGQFGDTYEVLRWSNEFAVSYVIGPLVAANFIGFDACSARFERTLARFEAPIRAVAGATFSIYLFHYPLLHFLGALLPLDPRAFTSPLVFSAATLLGCWLLSLVTEKKKHAARAALRALAGWTLAAARRARGP